LSRKADNLGSDEPIFECDAAHRTRKLVKYGAKLAFSGQNVSELNSYFLLFYDLFQCSAFGKNVPFPAFFSGKKALPPSLKYAVVICRRRKKRMMKDHCARRFIVSTTILLSSKCTLFSLFLRQKSPAAEPEIPGCYFCRRRKKKEFLLLGRAKNEFKTAI
jgi:hypothetical protein